MPEVKTLPISNLIQGDVISSISSTIELKSLEFDTLGHSVVSALNLINEFTFYCVLTPVKCDKVAPQEKYFVSC